MRNVLHREDQHVVVVCCSRVVYGLDFGGAGLRAVPIHIFMRNGLGEKPVLLRGFLVEFVGIWCSIVFSVNEAPPFRFPRSVEHHLLYLVHKVDVAWLVVDLRQQRIVLVHLVHNLSQRKREVEY